MSISCLNVFGLSCLTKVCLTHFHHSLADCFSVYLFLIFLFVLKWHVSCLRCLSLLLVFILLLILLAFLDLALLLFFPLCLLSHVPCAFFLFLVMLFSLLFLSVNCNCSSLPPLLVGFTFHLF